MKYSDPSTPDGEHQPHHSDRSRWFAYRERYHTEGYDDIISVNLLRPQQRLQHPSHINSEQMIVGRASGDIAAIGLKHDAKCCILKHFDTAGCCVRSSDINPNQGTLLASCLSDGRLVVYPIYDQSKNVSPSSEAVCMPEHGSRGCRPRSTKFLSSTKIAIGLGPSEHIVHVYDIGSGALSKEPLRRFGAAKPVRTSAYPVRALPNSAACGSGTNDNLILSGGYDGVIR